MNDMNIKQVGGQTVGALQPAADKTTEGPTGDLSGRDVVKGGVTGGKEAIITELFGEEAWKNTELREAAILMLQQLVLQHKVSQELGSTNVRVKFATTVEGLQQKKDVDIGNGLKAEGIFNKDNKLLIGETRSETGEVCGGSFRDGQELIRGTKVSADGTVTRMGSFNEAGQLQGHGKMIIKIGKDGLSEETHEGNFVNGKLQGDNCKITITRTSPKSKNVGDLETTVKTGTFIEDRLVNGEAEERFANGNQSRTYRVENGTMVPESLAEYGYNRR